MSRAGLSPEVVTRAAADLADEVGFTQVTLSAIARRFEVRLPSLYSHVAGSDDLRARVTLLALDELATAGERALEGRSGRDALVAYAELLRAYAAEHPGRYAAAGSLRVPASPEAARMAERMGRLSDSVLRGYDVPEAERVHAVRVVGSLLRGFLELDAGGAFAHSSPSGEASWHRALDVLDALLTDWPVAPPAATGAVGPRA